MTPARNQRSYQRQEDLIKKGDIIAGPIGSSMVSKVPEQNPFLKRLLDTRASIQNKAVAGLNLGTNVYQRLTRPVERAGAKIRQAINYQPKTIQTQVKAVAPKATPTPVPQKEYVPYFDFEKYANVPEQYKGGLAQPNGRLGREIMANFDQSGEATKAALVALSENMSAPYSPEGYNYNTPGDKRVTPGFEGTGDYGPWQINNRTMEDFMRRYPNTVKKMGITSVEDLKDEIKSTKLAKLIQSEQGWTNAGGGGWKGWVDKGITWKK